MVFVNQTQNMVVNTEVLSFTVFTEGRARVFCTSKYFILKEGYRLLESPLPVSGLVSAEATKNETSFSSFY